MKTLHNPNLEQWCICRVSDSRWEDPDLFILLQLLVVDLSYLSQLGAVVGVLYGVVRLSACCRRTGCSCCGRSTSLLRPRYTLSDQHVVQSHELRVWRLLLLRVPQTQHCNTTTTLRTRSQTTLRSTLVLKGRVNSIRRGKLLFCLHLFKMYD